MTLQFFLDTADIEAIKRAVELGVISGVTTNPSLAARAGLEDYREAVKIICDIVKGPVSIEVVGDGTVESLTAERMAEEAKELSKLSPYVVVKIPITREGLKAMNMLKGSGVKINATLCFSPNQAMLAALAGATYVSPFIGRLDDRGHLGMEVVREIAQIFRYYGIKTKIIASSIRHPRHVVEAALAGADVITIPPHVLDRMIEHPLTTMGLEAFMRDYREKVLKRPAVR